MLKVARLLAVFGLVFIGSNLLADEIPTPVFPPDPWEDEIPTPVFPPDPWE